MFKYCKLILLFLIILFFSSCSNLQIEEPKIEKEEKKQEILSRAEIDENLINFVKNLMFDLSLHNINLINYKYINQDFGFYNLFKIEGKKDFTFQKRIVDNKNEELYEISDIIKNIQSEAKNYVVIKQDLAFYCSPLSDEFYGWNGEGVYLSNKVNSDLLDIMIEKNKTNQNRYSIDELKKADFILKTAYKLVLTPELVVYISKIDKKWYITLIDRITTDCSSVKNN